MSILPTTNLNETKTPVVVYVSPGESVKVQETQLKNKEPNYLRIGNGTMNKHNIQAIDLLKELADSSKAEQYLLLAIKDGITWENKYSPIVRVLGDTTTQKQYIKSGYKSLNERNLVRRIKRGYYMINPNALIPIDYEQAIKDWNCVES